MKLRLASRASKLAQLQAREAWVSLVRALPGIQVEFVTVTTTGDDYRGALEAAPQKGVFTKEVDERVLANEADVAVHSLKDLPTELHGELAIAAVLERHHPGDLLFAKWELTKLPEGATVGTSSPRRRAQILRVRPDLKVVELRGNVPTRIERQRTGEVDAAPIAKAAAMRLGIASGFSPLRAHDFPHAPGQGAVALVCRKDSEAARTVKKADHEKTRQEVEAERAVLAALGGGCAVPMGAYARRVGSELEVFAELLSPDGKEQARIERRIPASRAAAAAAQIGNELASEVQRLS